MTSQSRDRILVIGEQLLRRLAAFGENEQPIERQE
jgi:hypothetical protein